MTPIDDEEKELMESIENDEWMPVKTWLRKKERLPSRPGTL